MDLSRREILIMAPAAARLAAAPSTHTLFVGTYTRGDSKGIYAFDFDPAAGKLSAKGLAAEIANPSFLAIHPNTRFLYAVGELSDFQGEKSGGVHAFSIDRETAKLKLLNSLPSGGTSPCHLVVDRTGRNLLVVNYGSGSSSVFRLKLDGSLEKRSGYVQHSGSGPTARQKGPHAHSVNLSKNNKFAVVADLGLDQYIVYSFNEADGTIAPHSVAKPGQAGVGPRHFNFHPSYKTAYGVNEMGSSVTVFDWSETKGELKHRQDVSTIPSGVQGNNCAEILVHPNGKFVYASNRGHDSIALFQLTADGGIKGEAETFSTQGKTPRNFRIDPSGKWLLAENQDTASIVVFGINQQTGKLTPSGETQKVDFPVCIRFL